MHGPGTPASTRQDSWLLFACGTAVMHLLVMLLCPRWALQPRPSAYWFFVGATLFFLVLPVTWSICLLFMYRSWRERVVSYVSLATSIFWLLMAQELLFQVLRSWLVYGR